MMAQHDGMRWQPDELVTAHEPVTSHDQLLRQPGRRDDDLLCRAVLEQGDNPRPHGRGDRLEGRLRLAVHHAGQCRQNAPRWLSRRHDTVGVNGQGEIHPDPLLIPGTRHGPVDVLGLLSPAAGQIHVPVCQAHGPDSRGESRIHP